MTLVLAGLVVVAFGAIVERASLVDYAQQVAQRSRDCIRILQDSTLDDDTKERSLREQTVRLLGLFGILFGIGLLAIALPLGGVWLLDQVGVASFPAVLDLLARPDFLVVASLLGLAAYFVFRGVRRS